MASKFVHMDNDSVKKLAAAIVMQSVTDYMTALIHDDQIEVSSCKTFFNKDSDWFDWLSNGMNGQMIMTEVEKKAKEFVKECLQHAPKYGDEKAAEKASFKCPCCGRKVMIHFGGNPLGKGRIFTRFYSYLCSSCGMSCKIRFDEDHAFLLKDRIKDVFTVAECSRCQHYDETEKYCRELGKKRDYDDVCFSWENRESWRDWLMQKKS